MDSTSDRDLSDEIASLRPILFRLALLQLRDKHAAEDATQDALVAALEGQAKFHERASLKTWLLSILRFKIVDQLRKKKRIGPPIDPHVLEQELDLAPFEQLFDETGCWATPKDAWSDPHETTERNEFFRVLEACLTKLPTNTSRVFLMREWLELTTDEVCDEVGVKPGNLRVMLYRARMQLRFCLDENWMRET
ncbi:MAG: sigma-70 family RNA polymerase sigma factor [Filomicrobium sp.]